MLLARVARNAFQLMYFGELQALLMHPMRVTQHSLLPEEPLPVHRACDGPIAMMPSYVIADSMRNVFGKDGGECVRSWMELFVGAVAD